VRKETVKTKRVRINMRMPLDLVRWGKGYAKKKGVSFTRVVVDSISTLKKKSRSNAK
jgi:hypothetical protein